MVDGDNVFYNLAKLRKYKTLDVTRDDRKNFISHRLKGISASGKEVSFTVLLRKQFKPSKYSDNWTWVEFWSRRPRGSNPGREGWIYGKAHFIAFETTKSFIIVSSKTLLRFLNTSPKVRYDLPFVHEAKDARYRILRDRKGRESTQVNLRDVKKLDGAKIWNKE